MNLPRTHLGNLLKKLRQLKISKTNVVARNYKVLLPVAILAITGTSYAAYTIHTNNAEAQRIAIAKSKHAEQLNAEARAKAEVAAAATANATKGDTKSAPTAPSVSTTQSSTTPTTKYSTSSDPRSTAYSTTPPGPNPASFNIKITHSGQLAPGAPLYYNADKNEKAFYGGDLVFNTPSVTISKSSANPTAPYVVSMPDGTTGAGAPFEPWDDHSSFVWAAVSTSASLGAGTSWSMFVELHYGTPPGSYSLHISTSRDAPNGDAWQYDGFLTVNVVD